MKGKRSKLKKGQERPAVYRKFNFRYPNPDWKEGDDKRDQFRSSTVSLDVSICVCAELAKIDVAEFVRENADDLKDEYNTSRAITRLLLTRIIPEEFFPKGFDWAEAEKRMLAHNPSGRKRAIDSPSSIPVKKDSRFDDF